MTQQTTAITIGNGVTVIGPDANGVTHYLIRGEEAPARGAGRPPIPDGLTRCERCGEFNGTAVFAPPAFAPEAWEVEVLCRCHGPLCHHCGREQIKRPCSYTYDERDGCVRSVASYCYLVPCRLCEQEARARAAAANALGGEL